MSPPGLPVPRPWRPAELPASRRQAPLLWRAGFGASPSTTGHLAPGPALGSSKQAFVPGPRPSGAQSRKLPRLRPHQSHLSPVSAPWCPLGPAGALPPAPILRALPLPPRVLFGSQRGGTEPWLGPPGCGGWRRRLWLKASTLNLRRTRGVSGRRRPHLA